MFTTSVLQYRQQYIDIAMDVLFVLPNNQSLIVIDLEKHFFATVFSVVKSGDSVQRSECQKCKTMQTSESGAMQRVGVRERSAVPSLARCGNECKAHSNAGERVDVVVQIDSCLPV